MTSVRTDPGHVLLSWVSLKVNLMHHFIAARTTNDGTNINFYGALTYIIIFRALTVMDSYAMDAVRTHCYLVTLRYLMR